MHHVFLTYNCEDRPKPLPRTCSAGLPAARVGTRPAGLIAAVRP